MKPNFFKQAGCLLLTFGLLLGALPQLTFAENASTEQGYLPHNYTICGDSYTDEASTVSGHRFGQWTTMDPDIRVRTCTLCGEQQKFYRLSLPQCYGGEVYVETNPSGLFYGTQNVAQILNLASGTYTQQGITIAIQGTQIAVSGTPTATLYFDLQTGTFGTPDYKRDVGYSLPDGDYRFGLVGIGSQSPTACIRYPDGIGNILASSKTVSKTGLSGADFGVPYLYLPAGKTYDFEGHLLLTLGTDATYDSQISTVKRIDQKGVFTLNGYLWSPDADTAVFGSYSDGLLQCTNRYIDIYLPTETGYLQVQMNLTDSDSKNAYGWRLNMMYICNRSFNKLFPVTSSGEYEMAIKLDGRPDFIGMGAHGSEIMTSFEIYIDGAKANLQQLQTMTSWSEIRMIRQSAMYDPADEITLVAHHTIIYDFDLEGLTVSQSVDWIEDYPCGISYMMMFPVRRTYGELQVTDTYFDDLESTRYDVSTPGFTTYPTKWTTGASKLTLCSEKSGVTATLENLESSQLTGTGYKCCVNHESYNKLYFTICGGGGKTHNVSAGDRWETTARYEVQLKPGTEYCSIYGHTYETHVTAPLCTEQGYTTHSCAVCGDCYMDSYVEATGHIYTTPRDTICSICGYERQVESHLPGDINGDGALNNKDATRLFQYISGWDVAAAETALDVNNDNEINNKDATRLFQYLSGWDVVIY